MAILESLSLMISAPTENERKVLEMDEYIEREAAIESIMSEPPDAHYPQWYADKIKAITAADVATVRHGRWVDRHGGKYANQLYECSECKRRAPYKFENDYLNIGLWAQDLTDYCPNCGAKMDGVHDG